MRTAISMLAAVMFTTGCYGGYIVEFVGEDIAMRPYAPLCGYLTISVSGSEPEEYSGCFALTCDSVRVTITGPQKRIYEIPPYHDLVRYALGNNEIRTLNPGREIRIPVFLFKVLDEFIFTEPGTYNIEFHLGPIETDARCEIAVGGEPCVDVAQEYAEYGNVYMPFTLSGDRVRRIIGGLGTDDECGEYLKLIYDYCAGGQYVRAILRGEHETDYGTASRDRATKAAEEEHKYNRDLWIYVRQSLGLEAKTELPYRYGTR